MGLLKQPAWWRKCLKRRRRVKDAKIKDKAAVRDCEYEDWLRKVELANCNFSDDAPICSPPQAGRRVDKDMLWKDYELHIGLYKHYMTIVATFVGLYYTVTGVFLGYYFKNIYQLDNQIVRAAIIFPIMMSAFFTIVFYNAYTTFQHVEKEIEHIARAFGFTSPEVHILTQILRAAFLMFGATCLFVSGTALVSYLPQVRGWLW